VSPVITHQLVEVVDTRAATHTLPPAAALPLDRCQVTAWGLQITTVTPDDPFVLAETCWLLPEPGLRVRRRRGHDARAVDVIEIGAVHIDVAAHLWRVTDLLLGLDVRPGRRPRVAHHADFAAAVAGGVLTATDADAAMSTVHRVLGELGEARHDLDVWTGSLGIGSLTGH
jgi:predicted RNA-binding protein associated with RNAse of E/G family